MSVSATSPILYFTSLLLWVLFKCIWVYSVWFSRGLFLKRDFLFKRDFKINILFYATLIVLQAVTSNWNSLKHFWSFLKHCSNFMLFSIVVFSFRFPTYKTNCHQVTAIFHSQIHWSVQICLSLKYKMLLLRLNMFTVLPWKGKITQHPIMSSFWSFSSFELKLKKWLNLTCITRPSCMDFSSVGKNVQKTKRY